jgi:hypothetical protein
MHDSRGTRAGEWVRSTPRCRGRTGRGVECPGARPCPCRRFVHRAGRRLRRAVQSPHLRRRPSRLRSQRRQRLRDRVRADRAHCGACGAACAEGQACSAGRCVEAARDVAVEREHACALGTSGHVECWGDGASGQLGSGTAVDSPVPVPVPGLSDATALSADGAAGVPRLAEHLGRRPEVEEERSVQTDVVARCLAGLLDEQERLEQRALSHAVGARDQRDGSELQRLVLEALEVLDAEPCNHRSASVRMLCTTSKRCLTYDIGPGLRE